MALCQAPSIQKKSPIGDLQGQQWRSGIYSKCLHDPATSSLRLFSCDFVMHHANFLVQNPSDPSTFPPASGEILINPSMPSHVYSQESRPGQYNGVPEV
jgi:hypothetical protein